MNYEVTGKLILKEDIQQVTASFQKRDFVIEVENERNPQWNDFIKVQLTQDRCDLLQNVAEGELIKVHFNLRGRKWEKDGKVSYFTNLEGWRIEKVTPEAAVPAMPEYKPEDIPPIEESNDDLPF
ncbi:MAG: DUF3127 domain-containing protein [Marinifilaceae bacterium]|nr:DUF3127 domain-containing protein [Marinifilaceae bacterium]